MLTSSETRILRATFHSMVDRCHNPRNPAYPRYGGRGVFVCDLWRDNFDAFAAHMGARPVGMSLDRIDNAKGYEPGNCRWADAKTQTRNSRTAKMSEQDVRVLLRLVHEEGRTLGDVGLVFPLSLSHLRSIALGKHFRLEGYAYPASLPRNQTKPPYLGGSAPKLDVEKVRELRQRYANGEPVASLAAAYGVSVSNAYNAATGRTWRCVK